MADRDEILEKFLWRERPKFFEPLRAIKTDTSPSLLSIVEAFERNLASAIHVGSVPFSLAQAAILNQRMVQLRIAERIRARRHQRADGSGLSDVEADELAARNAKELMERELGDPVEIDHRVDGIIDFLDNVHKNSEFRDAAGDLLRQVLVMLWGAFEVLATDIAIAVVDTLPELAERLASSKRLRFPAITLDLLKQNGFDLSKRLGSILFEDQRLDSLPLIQDALSRLFDNADLEVALKKPTLWKLFQRRNLVVHRRGIVDRQYVTKTGHDQQIGQMLTTNLGDAEESMIEVRDTGIQIIQRATVALQNPA